VTLAVGIDLGTTNSVLARLDATGQPVVVPNAEGRPTTPSVICFRDREIVVGERAKEMQALGTWPVAAFFKRQMGDGLFIFNAGGRDHSATDLSAMVLAKLKADAEAYLGEKIAQAVITVPAYFRDLERRATIAAGTAAELEVPQIINEPTAAAVAYGASRGQSGQRLIVYDLGGGTFDITLLQITGEGVRVQSSDGDHQLGGKDWDDRIIEFLSTSFRDEFGVDPLEDAESIADLLIQAEDVKKKLTSMQSAAISITYDGHRGRYTLDRSRFESLTADLLERTAALTTKVLDEERLTARNIDGILLVGGSTRMPMVHHFIEQTFGRPAIGGVNVDEAVALGAAIVAGQQLQKGQPTFGLRGRVKTIDVTNHSLGMIALNAESSAYLNSIILPKNAEIPRAETRPYLHRTARQGDNRIEVFMTQGESEAPAEVSYIGRYVIHDIPHQQGQSIVDVTYRYDTSGTVNVGAQLRGSKQDLRVSVEELPADVPGRFLVPPVKAAASHLTIYLAFDLSGSMSGEPLDEAKKAAVKFLHNTDLSHSSLGVVAFSDTARTKLKAGQNARAVERAIDDLQACETGVGNDGDPFGEILSLLKRVGGRRLSVVLADGVWTNQPLAIERARECHAAGIEVIAVGFGGADRSFLSGIASGEEASFFTPMSGLVETFSTIAQVLTESGAAMTPAGPADKAGRLGVLAGLRGALKR
jgi:molecular chaperone DnaK (HSP70)